MIGLTLRFPSAPAACTLAKTACRLPKLSGWSRIGAKGKISSLVFPVTLWKPRERLRAVARIIFFLAQSSRHHRRRHSARRRALSNWRKSAALSPYLFLRLAELLWRTPPIASLLAHQGSRPFAFFKTRGTYPLWCSPCRS